MTKSDAEWMRHHLNSIPLHEAITEVFGQPMGLLKQLSLGITSAFDPSKQWKFVTGNYANQLYGLWKRSAPPEATAEDLISWFENNKSTGFGPGASDLNYKTLNYIVSKVTRNILDKPLTNAQLQQIFLGLSDAVARELRGFSTKVIQNATAEQQAQVLELLPQLQRFIYAQRNSMQLYKIAVWMLDHVPGVNQIHVRNAFKRWQSKIMPLGAASAILPQPFDAMNKQRLDQVELSSVLALLDELLLQVILLRDQAEEPESATQQKIAQPTSTPAPATAAPKPQAPAPATPTVPPAAPDLDSRKQQLRTIVNQGFRGYEETGIPQQLIDQINQVQDMEDMVQTEQAINQFVTMWNRSRYQTPGRGA